MALKQLKNDKAPGEVRIADELKAGGKPALKFPHKIIPSYSVEKRLRIVSNVYINVRRIGSPTLHIYI